jgi:hypothetical protein
MARQRHPLYKPEWVPFPEMPQAFFLVGSKGTLYWRGSKGWWAQRPDSDGMVGPFPRDHQARKWAEEPARLAHEQKLQATLARAAAREAAAERAQAKTWGTLPPGEREFRPGQVWGMKQEAHRDHQVLILHLRKESVLVLVRSEKSPWRTCPQDVRSHHALLHLYRYQGEAKIPKGKIRGR